MREAATIPDSVETANGELDDRRADLIKSVVAKYLSKLQQGTATCGDTGLRNAIFGPWQKKDRGAVEASQRILAGLMAIDHGIQPEAGILTGANFPALVHDYIVNDVYAFENVGTTKDFDFIQMGLAAILYRFRTAEELLSNEAAHKIVHLMCAFPHLEDCSGEPQPIHLEFDIELPAKIGGFEVFDVPETENHVLMINAWQYLSAQWRLSEAPRTDIEVLEADNLKQLLMAALGRFTQNGAIETNARAYQALTIRPIMLLESFAADPQIQLAARNALDTIAVQYAFQSLNGKRLPPMRRRWEYRHDMGFYGHDHVFAQFGVLTGDLAAQTDPTCSGIHCELRKRSRLDVAMAALATDYQVPAAIHDLMLNPDAGNPGWGAWARMQARFNEREHLRPFTPARYPVPNGLGQPDLNQQIENGELEIEPTPELYFKTRDYLNSSGGAYEHFDYPWVPDQSTVEAMLDALSILFATEGIDILGIPGISQLVAFYLQDLKDTLEPFLNGDDFVSKPTILIGGHDFGYQSRVDSTELLTFAMRGNHANVPESNNTGVYKNLAYGYSTELEDFPFRIPLGLKIAQSMQSNGVTFAVIDPSTTGTIFAQPDYLIVIGNYGAGTFDGFPLTFVTPSLGFWEVVPSSLVEGADDPADALLQLVLANNSGNTTGEPFRYTMTVSGETLTFNPDYPYGGPFLEIDGNASMVAANHVSFTADPRDFPLIDVRQVNASYEFTNSHYACARGDGVVVVNNPKLDQQLIIDSRNHQNPSRSTFTLSASFDPCNDVLDGGGYTLPGE